MKVGTDALLLGAWVARLELSPQKILDIGTGTGILSLMLAQAYLGAKIEAIELDPIAAQEAKDNFANTLWHNRLQLIEGDALTLPYDKTYDLIISNPPYFAQESISAPNKERRLARQEQHLGLGIASLIHKGANLLRTQGRLCIILPSDSQEQLRQAACEALLYIEQLCTVFSSVGKAKRLIACLRPITDLSHCIKTSYTELLIRDRQGNYSPQYNELISPYLLPAYLNK